MQQVQKEVKEQHQHEGKPIQEADAFHRMNYLLQGSLYMANNEVLSRWLRSQCREVAQKRVQRIAANVKKLSCKKCGNCMVLDGRFKVQRKGGLKFKVKECHFCGTKKKVCLMPKKMKREKKIK